MENHVDSTNGSFQIYPPKKRKLFNIAQHNGSTLNNCGGTSIVATDNGSNTDYSVVGQKSYESLWDGTILLSSSVKANVAAFFESGEKIQGILWPELILIKGRVQLEAFEKFIRELSHSRNRAIMVISLCWKVGSSKVGLKGMKEVVQILDLPFLVMDTESDLFETLLQVASNFEVNQKVGLADIYGGCSLYVCPRSEAIIKILYVYGFLKGKLTNDTNQESLLGLVIWNRKRQIKVSNDNECETGKGHLSACADGTTFPISIPCSDSRQATPYSNSVDMASVRNTSMIQSSIENIQEMQGTSVNTQHVVEEITGETVYRPEAAIPDSPSKLALTLFLQSPQIASLRGPSVIATDQSQVPQMSSHEVPNLLLTTLETRQHVQPNKDTNCGPLDMGHPGSYFHVAENSTSAFKPYKTSLQKLPLQPQAIHSDLATQKNIMVGPFSSNITQEKHASSTSGSPEIQQNCSLLLHLDSYGAHIPDDKDDLPEFDLSSFHGTVVKTNVHPHNEAAGSVNGLIHRNLSDNESGQHFQQSSHSFFQVESISSRKNVEAQGTSTDICSEKITNPTSHCTVERVCFRDNDDVNNGGMTKRRFTDLAHGKLYKARAEAQQQSLPHITPRPQSPPRTECLSINRRPHMPSECSNPPRDEIFPPHHHPNVEANQGLFPRHPSTLAAQGLFPLHHAPVLAAQGLSPRHPGLVLANQGLFPQLHPPVLANGGLLHGHPRGLFRGNPPALPDQALFRPQSLPIPAYQGFFPRHPSHVPENGGFFPRHPSHVPENGGFFPRHPSHVPENGGFFPRHPSNVPENRGFFPRHPSHMLGNQGSIARPPTCEPGYFNSSGNHENNHGTFNHH